MKGCSFPHTHGDAIRTPENQDETCWKPKTSISYETSSNLRTVKLQNRPLPTSFFMSPPKSEISRSMFRARLPSIFFRRHKGHACHLICALSPLDAAPARKKGPDVKGCRRLQAVAGTNYATSSEHTLNPQTPKPLDCNKNPCYAFRKTRSNRNSGPIFCRPLDKA